MITISSPTHLTPPTYHLSIRMAWRLVRVVQPVGDKADAAEDSTRVRLRHARAAVNDPDVLLSQAATKMPLYGASFR